VREFGVQFPAMKRSGHRALNVVFESHESPSPKVFQRVRNFVWFEDPLCGLLLQDVCAPRREAWSSQSRGGRLAASVAIWRAGNPNFSSLKV
jgi:hypothetical protein